MFLKKAKKTYKGKVYITYALTESYRENGKVKHRNISNLGPLTEEQAERIRLVLKAKKIEDVFVGHLSDVVAKEHYRFLDIATLDDIWRQFDFDKFFPNLPYAEAMVINRCLEPKSKIRIQNWTQRTVLPRLLKVDFKQESEYGIYRALDKIADQEKYLQQHIYQKCKQFGHTNESAIFYDITSSYFEGSKCILATHGYSRDHRPDRLQITIALVITPNGFPFYWRVIPGNTQDITTVKDLLSELKDRFSIKECLLVFDRGMVSQNNLKDIADNNLTYVSALDKDEIPGLNLLTTEFQSLVADKHWQNHLLNLGFNQYNDNLFYRTHLADNDKRYILAFDRQVYKDQQQNRQRRLQKSEDYITICNKELQQAKKSRNADTTKRNIEKQLRKWNLHKIIDFQLEPITIITTTPKGKEKKVKSFQVVYTVNEDRLKRQEYLDGIACFITNQPQDKLTSAQAIKYYRRKNKVEEAFREIKDYLRLRPFYLNREKRVRAHVSICVLGYLLLNALEDKLRQQKQSISSVDFLDILGRCLLNHIGLVKEKTYTESITEISDEQLRLLKITGLKHLISKKYLDSILEQYGM